MFHPKRDPRDAALDQLKDRLSRDSQTLRAAVEACPEGMLPEALEGALIDRATVFGRMPTVSRGTFSVRG